MFRKSFCMHPMEGVFWSLPAVPKPPEPLNNHRPVCSYISTLCVVLSEFQQLDGRLHDLLSDATCVLRPQVEPIVNNTQPTSENQFWCRGGNWNAGLSLRRVSAWVGGIHFIELKNPRCPCPVFLKILIPYSRLSKFWWDGSQGCPAHVFSKILICEISRFPK